MSKWRKLGRAALEMLTVWAATMVIGTLAASALSWSLVNPFDESVEAWVIRSFAVILTMALGIVCTLSIIDADDEA